MNLPANTLVSLAHRIGFEGPIAGYRILADHEYGDHIELWDFHGRHVYVDLAKQEPLMIKPPRRSKPKHAARKGGS